MMLSGSGLHCAGSYDGNRTARLIFMMDFRSESHGVAASKPIGALVLGASTPV